jgi:hypothetical protein
MAAPSTNGFDNITMSDAKDTIESHMHLQAEGDAWAAEKTGTTTTGSPESSSPRDIAASPIDDSRYYEEVGLLPLARILGLAGDTVRTEAISNRCDQNMHVYPSTDPIQPPCGEAFSASSPLAISPAVTASSKTGANAALPENQNECHKPYLLQHVMDGKIRFYLNSMIIDSGQSRMLYRVHNAEKDTYHWLEIGHSQATHVKPGDIILERNLTNYKLFIKAFHLMRFRKAELRKEWQRQNPDRSHLLRFHPYEWTEGQIKQFQYEVKSWDRLVTFERTAAGEIRLHSRVYRRLVFRRGLPDQTHHGEEPAAVYIDVCSGDIVNRKPSDVILPETEEVYSRLAYFLAAQRAQDWQPPKDTGVPRRPPKPAPGISQRNLAHKAISTPDNPNTTTVTLQASTTEQAPPQNTGKRGRDEKAEDEHGAKRAKSVTLQPKVQSGFKP